MAANMWRENTIFPCKICRPDRYVGHGQVQWPSCRVLHEQEPVPWVNYSECETTLCFRTEYQIQDTQRLHTCAAWPHCPRNAGAARALTPLGDRTNGHPGFNRQTAISRLAHLSWMHRRLHPGRNKRAHTSQEVRCTAGRQFLWGQQWPGAKTISLLVANSGKNSKHGSLLRSKGPCYPVPSFHSTEFHPMIWCALQQIEVARWAMVIVRGLAPVRLNLCLYKNGAACRNAAPFLSTSRSLSTCESGHDTVTHVLQWTVQTSCLRVWRGNDFVSIKIF